MKLLDTLVKKRNYHVMMAQKFADLIAVVQGDADFAKHTHDRTLSIMDEARLMAATTNGNGSEPGPEKRLRNQSPEFRARQAKRMKKMWKEHRGKMLKAVQIGLKASLQTRKRNKRAREQQQAAAGS